MLPVLAYGYRIVPFGNSPIASGEDCKVKGFVNSTAPDSNNCHFCQNTPAEKQKINPRIVVMNFNNASMLDKVYNAQLSGEQRTNQPAAHHLKHPKSPQTKNATRWESA